MDYNAQMYANDLTAWTDKFVEDGVNFTGLQWKSDDDKSYYSLLVNPCGYIVYEIISPKTSHAKMFKESSEIRFSFASKNNLGHLLSDKHLRAIGISRGT